ncbi:hypothetical protein [Frigoriglobus tundricola]|uniref:Uncharacterized protein n=1 Tax=Frigoriglobus tundricola TaxID=2774151 RepID=A0A6M5Z477_9BACT|nr:hypothetical protein [Frigoriglobus tundricola]QJX01208.1 hypothetical protein FTUN_8847 [Frigoriglobus tundricola]
MSKWTLRVLLGVVVVALALGAIDSGRVYWVGGTDLEVQFVVVDAGSGVPITGAEVTVRSGGGWYTGADQEREAGGFALPTDTNGSACRVCRNNWVVGEDSGLGFTHIRSVYMPRWSFRVSAPGYLITEPAILDQPEFQVSVRRVSPGADKLEIRVPLHRLD